MPLTQAQLQRADDLEDLMLEAERRGDMETAKTALVKMEELESSVLSSYEQYGIARPTIVQGEVPQLDESGVPIVQDYSTEKPAPTMGERAKAVGETALTVGTGMTTGLVGTLVGTGKGLADIILSGEYGTPEGAEKAAKLAEQYAQNMTYIPESELGQEYAQNVGEVMGATVGALPPTMGAISSPFKKLSPAKQKVVDLVNKNSDDVQRSGFTVKQTPIGEKLSKTNAAKSAQKAGIDEGTISVINTATRADKDAMLKSLEILEKGKSSKTYAAINRPGDVVGQLLMDRYNKVRTLNKQAGGELNKAAAQIKGVANVGGAFDNFIDGLLDAGVSITRDKNGNLRGFYENSILADSRSSQNMLNKFIAKSERRELSPGDAHTLKRRLQKLVEFDATKENRQLTPDAERAINGLQRDLNKTLRDMSSDYAKANDKFSSTRGAMDEFESVAGRKFDPDKPNIDKEVTRTARNMMSNNANRVPSINAVNSLQEVAKKNGVKFNDDILKQIIFMDELETMFGSSAPTSFMGQIEKAVSAKSAISSVARGDIIGAGAEAAKAVTKRGVNEDALIKAMRELLTE